MARQKIELAAEEAEELSRRARATTISVRDRRRAEIIVLSAQGLTQQRIAEQLGISRVAVNRWVGRFALQRLDGLSDRAGRGRRPWLPQAAVHQVLEQAVTPPPHLGRWSCRTMARAAAISPASVQRLWAASDIKPHLSRSFKLSNDKRFEEKFWDVIGLYLNPPDKALVLCCDEKSQCQALERTQPGLPLGIGHIRTKTHDYVRHGTLTLFAALNYLEGKLITRLAARHRHQEWLAFLKLIDQQSSAELDIHIIADNYATHKHPQVKKWLERHARFHNALHANLLVMDELGGAVLRRSDGLHQREELCLDARTGRYDHHLLGGPQRQSSALRVEGQGRRYPAQNRRRQTRARRWPCPMQLYFRYITLECRPVPHHPGGSCRPAPLRPWGAHRPARDPQPRRDRLAHPAQDKRRPRAEKN